MASKAEKAKVVAGLVEELQHAAGAVFVDFRGMTVSESAELRKQLREAGVRFRVVKNTMLRLAAKELEIEDTQQAFFGPTAVAVAEHDPVAMAKVLSKFHKDSGKLEIKAGLLGTTMISVDEVQKLADLPSREELLAKVAGGIAAPLVGFAGVSSGILRNVVYAFDALRRQKEQEEAA